MSSPSATSSGPTVPVVAGPALDDSYARALPELVLDWPPTPVAAPRTVWVNDALADDLGIDPAWLRSDDGVAVLSGSAVPAGAHTVAMGYAGHQFGGYSPRLGDGRALLLGELVGDDGSRADLHLKGSGRTPFARGGDGRATVGPMLREVLVSEALHALGVPTTRSLAVVTTGDDVLRADGPEPGAVLTRVAASHIRVGTFEYAARLGVADLVPRLAEVAIARHHPAAAHADEPLLALLEAVVAAQARLVGDWMQVGFIHGVMNTDNTTISGEGIDYGPCAFMDVFDPATVFSSIDHQGRYAFANQPPIAVWNLSRLAETLIAAMRPDDPESMVAPATEVLQGFEPLLDRHWRDGMRARLGLVDPPADAALTADLMKALQGDALDLTGTFRLLARWRRGEADLPAGAGALAAWTERWTAEVERQGLDPTAVAAAMDAVNPVHVPRNHLVDEALSAATSGDLGPFEALLDVVTDPFTPRPGGERYAEPAPTAFTEGFRTFCGT